MKKQVFVILLLTLMVGCKTQQTIVSTTSSNSSLQTNHATIDHVHDTTYIDRFHYVTIKPDTVFIRDSIIVYKFRDRYLKDTITVEIRDTFNNVVTETIEKIKVEKVTVPGSKFLTRSGIALWIILFIVVIILVWKIARGKLSFINKIKNLFVR